MTTFFILFFGLAVGSFLNLLADRLPKGEDVFTKPSHCDFCKHKLSALDLIPLLSFIFLKGKCRYCKKRLSLKYPVTELVTGLGFLGIYKYFDITSVPFLLILFSVLLVILLSDLWYFIIPDSMLVVGIVTTIVYKLFFQSTDFWFSLITGVAALLFFYFLHIVTRGRGMGFGDVKYAFLMGLLLGFPAVVISLYIAFLTGAGVGIILIIIGSARLKTRIPFGPFLVLATAITFIWKEQLTILFLRALV